MLANQLRDMRLRKKLDGIGVHDYLTTKRGLGYLV